ncbi:MAG: 2-hydroxyacyl-CoA dehydratase family protein [Desulfobacterales bacterium]
MNTLAYHGYLKQQGEKYNGKDGYDLNFLPRKRGKRNPVTPWRRLKTPSKPAATGFPHFQMPGKNFRVFLHLYAGGSLMLRVSVSRAHHRRIWTREKAFQHVPDFICPYMKRALEKSLTGDYDFLSGLVQGYSCDAGLRHGQHLERPQRLNWPIRFSLQRLFGVKNSLLLPLMN